MSLWSEKRGTHTNVLCGRSAFVAQSGCLSSPKSISIVATQQLRSWEIMRRSKNITQNLILKLDSSEREEDLYGEN